MSTASFWLTLAFIVVFDAFCMVSESTFYEDQLNFHSPFIESLVMFGFMFAGSAVMMSCDYGLLTLLVRRIKPNIGADQIRQGFLLWNLTIVQLTVFLLPLLFLEDVFKRVNDVIPFGLGVFFFVILLLLSLWWLGNRVYWLAAITGSGLKASIVPCILYLMLTVVLSLLIEFMADIGLAQWHQLPWPTFAQVVFG